MARVRWRRRVWRQIPSGDPEQAVSLNLARQPGENPALIGRIASGCQRSRVGLLEQSSDERASTDDSRTVGGRASAAFACRIARSALACFVTVAMQPVVRSPFEQEISRAASLISAELASATVQPPHSTSASPRLLLCSRRQAPRATSASAPVKVTPTPRAARACSRASNKSGFLQVAPAQTPVEEIPTSAELPMAAEMPPAEPVLLVEPVPVFVYEPSLELDPVVEAPFVSQNETVEAAHVFKLDTLPLEEQELHKRASRVAKVSMQDIKMIYPP